MSSTAERPPPVPTYYSRPFWEAAANRRLIVQVCLECDRAIMYPKRYCPHCMSDRLDWREASGRGKVYSYTVQERGAPTGFADRTPYVIAIIALDEGVHMMSNIVGPDAVDVACDDRVKVDFEPVEGSDVVLPVFRRTGIQGAGT